LQNRLQRLALARPHRLQLFQQRRNLAPHAFGQRGLVLVAVGAVVALQRSGQAQNGVQIRLAAQAVLLARGGEGGQVAVHQFAIVAGRLLAAAIDGERQIHVAANQVVLERLAQLHLQRVQARRQAQLHVEKAVIHALDAERVAELPSLGRGTRT
jgi:hypothetical protein